MPFGKASIILPAYSETLIFSLIAVPPTENLSEQHQPQLSELKLIQTLSLRAVWLCSQTVRG